MATSRRGAQAAAPGGLKAYVLHRWDWSETSLIVELFSREQGRVVVAAKGAKRPTSQFRPILLPFQPLVVHLGRTPADEQGEVRNLRGAEWAGGQPLLGAGSLLAGCYLNELLLKLLARQDPHPALFDAYADALAALATEPDEAAALRAFELRLLRELGVLPELATATLTAEPVQPAGRYALHPEAGVIADRDGLPGSLWIALEAALAHAADAGHGQALRHACAGRAGVGAGALREPLAALLHHHLGHARLQTRRVRQGLQRLAEAPVTLPDPP